MIVPMRAGPEIIGTVSFVMGDESGRVLDREDVELAKELGRRAGTAVENARRFAERSEIADTLERALLPPALPSVPGWEIASLYRAGGQGNDVGGDFYDIVEGPDGWTAIIGDVTGRGAGAAALTSLARYTLRTAIRLGASSVEALEELNRALLERGDLSLCTAALAQLGGGGESFSIVSAGHPFPIVVRSEAASVVGTPGHLLGALEQPEWHPTQVELGRGDGIVLYTDGVTETRGAEDRFGVDRLEDSLAGITSAPVAIAALERDLEAFAGTIDDDTAIVALMRE